MNLIDLPQCYPGEAQVDMELLVLSGSSYKRIRLGDILELFREQAAWDREAAAYLDEPRPTAPPAPTTGPERDLDLGWNP
jgi:hypothetical protein